jgi:hypothetical protein
MAANAGDDEKVKELEEQKEQMQKDFAKEKT